MECLAIDLEGTEVRDWLVSKGITCVLLKYRVPNPGPHQDKRLYPAVDAADTESCRPDFAVALYPGQTTEKTTKEFELNPTLPVSVKTPPTLLLQSVDDPVDDVGNSHFYTRWPRLVEAWLGSIGIIPGSMIRDPI